MRALAVLVVLATGCGRFGFTEGDIGASDAALDDGQVDDASADAFVPPDVIRVSVTRAKSGAIVPVVDAMFVAIDGAGEHVARTDADGRAELAVDGISTVHVAFDSDSTGMTIVSYVDVPSGTALSLGPMTNRGAGSNIKNFPIPAYVGASGYNTVLPDVCGTSGYADDPIAVASFPPACLDRALPAVFLARSGASTLAGFVASIHSETTTTVTGTWAPLVAREIEVAPVPGYAFSSAMTRHRIGSDTITLVAGPGSYGDGIARVSQLDFSVDQVLLHSGSGAVTHSQKFDVPPAVGPRSIVDPSRAMTALASVQRDAGNTIRWTLAGAPGAREGSFVMTREFYGSPSTIHYTYAPAARLFTTRARLPAPYDTLADGASMSSAEALMYLVGDQGYTASLARMDGLARGGDIYWIDGEYAVNHRVGSN